MDINEIKKILPHREPFLMIDGIEKIEPGVSVEGYKLVKEDEYYFQGHFPGEPVMPGVLIVEALAQAGATAILCLPENKGKIAFFGRIKNTRFKKIVKPGDRLDLKVDIIKIRQGVGKGTGIATVNGEVACKIDEFSFALGE